MPAKPEPRPFVEENQRLRARLDELEETLRAIRSGEVDALVVETATGEDQVFTLKGADEIYRLMVEQMPKGAATLSPDGVVLYCNPFLAALLDVPLESVLGVPLANFMDAPTAASLAGLLQAAAAAAAAAGGIVRSEVSFRRREGSVLTQMTLTPLPIDGAHVVCMIVTDLTDRKRHEDERAQLVHEQVARAAAEEANDVAQDEIGRRKLVEESLRAAEKERTELLECERSARAQAEEANRLKDEFLATLSHELRSPLSAIVAWAHVLRQPSLDPDTAKRGIDAIDRNARTQAQLVDDLLDVSRIVTGNFRLSMGPVRLLDVIEAAADTVRPAARAKDIRLELSVDPAAELVLGDASRLQQVIWNLLSNAIRFAPSGGSVHLRTANADSSVELSVTDDGGGIDPAFLPFIFDRFRQADSSSTRRHAGLGLGLAIVRHLIELHGGTVEARNNVGGAGATFIVRLPRRQQAATDRTLAPASEPEKATVEAAPRAYRSLDEVRVLVVDDDADTREAMAIGLGRCGARVATARSVSEALGALERERPHVLVADIAMPGEDGHALLRKLRLLPAEHGGATPAIALTAYASTQDRLKALQAGFQMHLAKPVTAAALAVAVASLSEPARTSARSIEDPDPDRQGPAARTRTRHAVRRRLG